MLVTALLMLASRDVAVVDVGGGPRADEIRAVIMELDPTTLVIPASDARALYDTYGRACGESDAPCWQKAARAASVQAVVLVPAEDRLLFVDVARQGSVVSLDTTHGTRDVVERGLFFGRFGSVVIQNGNGGRVFIDGAPLAPDGLIKPGPHVVHIEAPGFASKDVHISVAGGAAVDVDGTLTPLSPGEPENPAKPPSRSATWIWPAAAGGAALAGLGVGVACEVIAGQILADAEAGKGGSKSSLDAVHGVELAAFVVAGLATGATAAGASVWLSEAP